MQQNSVDFPSLAADLLSQISSYVMSWCPGGRTAGNEYKAASIRGGQGDSFSINLTTGAWADFATGEKGGDLISLYAAIEGIKQGNAARILGEQIGVITKKQTYHPEIRKTDIGIPPDGTIVPDMTHPIYGPPSNFWCYRNEHGLPIFFEARYDPSTGKQFAPWSWDRVSGKWVMRGFPAPRPLYGLEQLTARPDSNVMIVEGAKCVEAARTLGNAYVVVSWPNGASSYSKTNWLPLKDRKVLIWPDADEPGIKAADAIAEIISAYAQEIKIIDVAGMPEKWDAADAISEGWDWKKFVEWAKPRARILKAKREPVAVPTTIINHTENHLHVNKEDEDSVSRNKSAMWSELGISVTHNGQPHYNISNAVKLFENHDAFNDLIWFDEFHQKYFTSWKTGKKREWSDVDTLNLVTVVQRDLQLVKMTDEMIFKASIVYAHQRVRNEPRDWFESLKWDGKNRCHTFFWDCFGVDQTEYAHAIGKNFWVGMIARIFRPGCQLDNMVVLEGAQGIGKTKALRAIAGPWYASAKESILSKDFFMVLHGKLIVEIAELDAFSRVEVTRIKGVVTDTIDRYRSPFARTAQDHPRMSIFVGSTNEDNYLRDQTGGRRFWPLKCNRIDLGAIESNREQLFAEAVHRFKADEDWYIVPELEAKQEQAKRLQHDEWETKVAEYLFGKADGVTLSDVAQDCLKMQIDKLEKHTQLRISKAMYACGWESKFEPRFGINATGWYKKKD